MNCWHLSIIIVADTIDASFDLLNSVCLALSPRILLIDLILAGRRSVFCFSDDFPRPSLFVKLFLI